MDLGENGPFAQENPLSQFPIFVRAGMPKVRSVLVHLNVLFVEFAAKAGVVFSVEVEYTAILKLVVPAEVVQRLVLEIVVAVGAIQGGGHRVVLEQLDDIVDRDVAKFVGEDEPLFVAKKVRGHGSPDNVAAVMGEGGDEHPSHGFFLVIIVSAAGFGDKDAFNSFLDQLVLFGVVFLS